MIALPTNTDIFLYSHPTDMRKSFCGLAGIVRNELGREPGDGSLFLFINRNKWDSLPTQLQTIISAATTWLNHHGLIERTERNGAALASLVQDHGVQLRQFPKTVLRELGKVSDQILRERASQDKLSQEIFDSIMLFRQKASNWAMVSLQPFLKARGAL